MVTSIIERIQSSKSSKSLLIPNKLKAFFLKSTSELLQEGFSLKQALAFVNLLIPKHSASIQYINDELEKGNTFEHSLRHLGYSLPHVAQLFYAQRQGRFIASLLEVSQQLEENYLYRQKLSKTLIYPILLGIFLIIMLFGMRTFMLPHIASFITQAVYDEQLLVRILVGFFTYLPQLFGFLLAFCLLLYGSIDYYLLRKEPIERFRILVHLPLLSKWTRIYCSYKVARELGHFFSGGYSMQQTIQVLVDYPIDPFLSEVALIIDRDMKQGIDLAIILEKINIFTPELPLIIYQGELTSQTAQKCKLYSRKLYSDLMQDIERKIGMVQPLMFILIALLVMAMYLVMMLPMLTMEGL